ncbi:hypothetical protein D3C76_1867390 [compost metagenome]
MFIRELINEQEIDDDFRIVKGEIDELQSQYNEYQDQIDSLNKKIKFEEKNNNVLIEVNNFIQNKG